jgi:phenylacetate-CoA ligase
MWIGGYTDHQSLEATGAAVIPFGVGNTENLIETILLIKQSAIHCTPSYLAKISFALKQEFNMDPHDLGLRLGLFGGESGLQNPQFRENIEKTWGIKAMNANYGLADVLSMFGAECVFQKGLHFMGDGVLYPELIDPVTGAHIELNTGAEGELVLTNLRRESQPLLRFRTNDIIRILSTEPCSCENKGFRFEVVGRSDDMITIKGLNVFVSAIEKQLFSHLDLFTGVIQIHVNQEDPIDRLLIKLEHRSNLPYPTHDFIENLIKEIRNRISITPEMEILNEGSLPRTEGKSRKIFRTL